MQQVAALGWSLPVAVERMHVGALHAVAWGEDPCKCY